MELIISYLYFGLISKNTECVWDSFNPRFFTPHRFILIIIVIILIIIFFIVIFATQKSRRVVNNMRIFNYLSLFQAFG